MPAVPSNIYITAMGMVSPLGYGADIACAAARAGISRPIELDYYTVWSPDDGDVSFVTGHAIPELTLGFEDDARLLRIMQAALSELRTSVGHRWDSTFQTGLYAALSDPFREQSGAALVADEQIQSEMESAQRDDSQPIDDEPVMRQLAHAAQLAGLPTQPVVRFISRQGQTATTQCVMRAREDLDAGKISHAVILACDSLLGEMTLEWLENTGRLKSPAIPAGLAPSESGVAFLLETSPDESDALARLGPTDLGDEPQSLLSGETVLGNGLADLLRTIDWSDGSPWLITDQNGEEYRAMEWGQALVRVIRDVPQMNEAVLTYPAIAFGDTGAASGGIAVATAVHAIRRGFAPNPHAVVLSSADNSSRGSIQLHAV